MNHVYLGAFAFGVTLLLATLFLGGKDTDHGHGHDAGGGLGWAPVLSLRFWVFVFTFGGGAGLALDWLGSSAAVAAVGAVGIGWASGAGAVAIVRSLAKHSVSSELRGAELVGHTGTLVLPVGPGKPGKVRIDAKGRIDDYVAHVVEDGGELASGTAVLIIAEGGGGSLIVARGDL